MKNDYMSTLDRAVANLNSNVDELLLSIHQMNTKITELRGKMHTGSKQANIGSQFVVTKISNVSKPSYNNPRKDE